MYVCSQGLTYSKFSFERHANTSATIRVARTDLLEVNRLGTTHYGFTVVVTNIGDLDADAVVLAFLTPDVSGHTPHRQPNKKLIGFERVSLLPAQSRTVHLALTRQHLSLVSDDGREVAPTVGAVFGVEVGDVEVPARAQVVIKTDDDDNNTAAGIEPASGHVLEAKTKVPGEQLLPTKMIDRLEASTPPCRDRFLEPFSSTSIWNTAIGSCAEFSPAHLFGPGREPTQFHNDQDFFLRVTEADPLTAWIDQGDWGGDDHCHVTGKVVSHLRFPQNWTSASDCGGQTDPAKCSSKPNQPNNNAMGVLLADGETIVQMQPAYRCVMGGALLARFGNTTDGCPQQFPNVTSIFGDGALGSHGGSGLSGVGGTIRLGELLPSSGPIQHAIKIELQHQWYYGSHPLQRASVYNGGRGQYVWPATGSDGGSNKAPGGLYSGNDPHVAPGALLALPADVGASIKTSTVVGRKIKQALIDYGGYIVDDTGNGNSVAICMESQVNDEMRKTYGFTMTYPHGVSNCSTDPGKALYSDLLAIFQALHAVINNAPGSIGGGGKPRVPPKPPICGAPSSPPAPSPALPCPPPPPAPPTPATALCQIKIAGSCRKYPQLPKGQWFDDSKFGGPPATTSSACCGERARGWRNDCGPSCQVDCKFSP